ncbi:MAG: ABC transporter ATP-binding protein [Lachnospiraceae bacterium]|nr:ABC transporter ATP-binding protein [Lachnospiraceae bacterium]
MIEVSGLTKRYGKKTAIDNLSFRLEKDRIYGFLGPNGAGKSTTMNILTGYLASNSGTVLIDGFDVLKEPYRAKKNIGYLPEIPPVYPDMTVREYLHFASELKGIGKKERRHAVEEVMEKTGVSDVSERLIRNLSKGYKQRTGLAQAILGYPDVIILDEPTVGLDPKQIMEMRELIKSLRPGRTIVLSSHILQEISAVCDHIMIISNGKLVASDTAENIRSSMAGKTRIELNVRASAQKTDSILSETLTGEKTWDTKGLADGTTDVMISCPAGNDIREQIFFAFAAASVPILEMKSITDSLEDIYLTLTENSDKETEDAVLENGDKETEDGSAESGVKS